MCVCVCAIQTCNRKKLPIEKRWWYSILNLAYKGDMGTPTPPPFHQGAGQGTFRGCDIDLPVFFLVKPTGTETGFGVIPQGTNISHLGKRKIIFKSDFWWDMLVPWMILAMVWGRGFAKKNFWKLFFWKIPESGNMLLSHMCHPGIQNPIEDADDANDSQNMFKMRFLFEKGIFSMHMASYYLKLNLRGGSIWITRHPQKLASLPVIPCNWSSSKENLQSAARGHDVFLREPGTKTTHNKMGTQTSASHKHSTPKTNTQFNIIHQKNIIIK